MIKQIRHPQIEDVEPQKPRGRGRPRTRFSMNVGLHSDVLEWIREYGLRKYGGASVKMLEDTFLLPRGSWLKYVSENPEFAAEVELAIEDYRASVEPVVVKSLFNMARGYDYIQETEEEKFDGNGNLIGSSRKKRNYHVPPNVVAGIFLLTNLAPERWKQKQQQEISVASNEEKCIQVEVVSRDETKLLTDEQCDEIIQEVSTIEYTDE